MRRSEALQGVRMLRFLYRIGDSRTVEVGRVLHDAMELARHVQFEFPPEP